MNRQTSTFIISLSLFLAGAGAQSANAQVEQFQLPTDPAAWLNSPPISMDVLKGKAVMLYFFEES